MFRTYKPAPGRVVPNPDRRHEPLKEEGETVAVTDYWLRRERDADVIVVEPDASTSPEPEAPPPAAAPRRAGKPRADATE